MDRTEQPVGWNHQQITLYQQIKEESANAEGSREAYANAWSMACKGFMSNLYKSDDEQLLDLPMWAISGPEHEDCLWILKDGWMQRSSMFNDSLPRWFAG